MSLLSRLARGLTLVLALGAGPASAQAVDARLAEALSYCIDNFPNTGRASQLARGAGFRSEGRIAGFEFFSAYRRELLAGYDGGSDAKCLLGLDGLRDAAAIDAAALVVGQKFGADLVRLGPSPNGDFIEGWVASANGTGLLIGVQRQITIGNFWRGSLITVQGYEPPPQ